MSSKQKIKGSAWEREVVRYLGEYFPTLERRQSGSLRDKGDLQGVPYWVFECKDHKALKLAEWTDHLWEQLDHAGATYGVVIAKRARKPVSEAYAVLPLALFRELLNELTGDK